MKGLKRIWILTVCVLLLLTGCKKEQDAPKQPEIERQENQENTEKEQELPAENPESEVPESGI